MRKTASPLAQVECYNNRYDYKLLMEDRCPEPAGWCSGIPTPAMAQAAQMSTAQFTDFYFDVCTLDYARMSKAMDPLKELMDRTDKVRITAK